MRSADPPIMIQVRGLSKQYVRGHEGGRSFHGGLASLLRLLRHETIGPSAVENDTFWALDDVSFDVQYGERVGIIGRNGAGKSTLVKILSRVIYPTCGEARLRGRLVSLLEVGTGFNGDLTGRENRNIRQVRFLDQFIHRRAAVEQIDQSRLILRKE